MKFTGPVAALLVLALGAGAVHAQGFLRNIDRDYGLSPEDISLLREAGGTLYATEPLTLGAETIWMNPETHSHGTVEVVQIEDNCATVEHLFRVGPTKKVHSVLSRRCKSEDGDWKLAPSE